MPAASPTNTPRWLDESRLDASSRPDLRRRWDVADEQRVVALLADSTEAMDAAKAIVAVGLAAETGRPWRLLMHPMASGAHRARHLAAALGRDERLILDESIAQPWTVLPGVDAALIVGEPCEIAMTWAMLAGVPIVAEHNATTDAWLEHETTALLSRPGRMRKLSWGLCRVSDDTALASCLGEAACDRVCRS